MIALLLRDAEHSPGEVLDAFGQRLNGGEDRRDDHTIAVNPLSQRLLRTQPLARLKLARNDLGLLPFRQPRGEEPRVIAPRGSLRSDPAWGLDQQARVERQTFAFEQFLERSLAGMQFIAHRRASLRRKTLDSAGYKRSSLLENLSEGGD